MTTFHPTVFLDTETTGLHANRRAWEIAMIRECLHSDGGPVHTETMLIQVSDVDLHDADPMALRVGKFYERFEGIARYGHDTNDDPKTDVQLIPEVEAAAVVEAWTRGGTIVGACPWFDTETLEPMLRRHGLVPSWSHRLRCVESLTEGMLGRKVGGLRLCAEALHVAIDEHTLHTALGDSLLTQKIYHHVMDFVPAKLPVEHKAGS